MKLVRSFLPTLFLCLLYAQAAFAAPAVAQVSPNRGPAAGGTTVTITGTGFSGAPHVFFGPTSATVITSTATQITAQAPASVPGTVHITVQVGPDISPQTSADRYTYQGDWFAYIASTSNFAGNNVFPLDLADNIFKSPIPLPNQNNPTGIAITPDGRKAYVGDESNPPTSHVYAIDLVNGSTTDIPMAGHQSSSHVAISPDGTTVVTSLSFEAIIQEIDVATNALGGTIGLPAGYLPLGLGFSPDGTKIYVSSASALKLSVLSGGVMTDEIFLGSNYDPIELAVTPDGSEVYIADFGSTDLKIVSTTSLTVTTLPLGGGVPLVMPAISPDGQFAYITAKNEGGFIGRVYQVSIPTKTFLNTTNLPHIVIGIAITPDGKRAYVCLPLAHEIIVLDLTQTTAPIIDTISMGTDKPFYIAISPDPAPAADFAITSIGQPGSATQFDGSGSVSAVGTIEKYVWNFGDGSPEETTTTPTVSHTYTAPGTYTVELIVTNSGGTSVTQTFTRQTVSNQGSFDIAHIEKSVTISAPPMPPAKPSNFKGKIRKHHGLILKTHWRKSSSSNVVGYEILKKHTVIETTTNPFFTKRLHPKEYYRKLLSKYKKDYLENRYFLRAVNSSGMKSKPIHLDMK